MMCTKQGWGDIGQWYNHVADETLMICEYCALHAFNSNEVNKIKKDNNSDKKCALVSNSFHKNIDNRVYLRYNGLRLNAHYMGINSNILRPAPQIPKNLKKSQQNGYLHIQLPNNVFWTISLTLDDYGEYNDKSYWLQYTLRNNTGVTVACSPPSKLKYQEIVKNNKPIEITDPQLLHTTNVLEHYWLNVIVFQLRNIEEVMSFDSLLFEEIDSIYFDIYLHMC